MQAYTYICYFRLVNWSTYLFITVLSSKWLNDWVKVHLHRLRCGSAVRCRPWGAAPHRTAPKRYTPQRIRCEFNFGIYDTKRSLISRRFSQQKTCPVVCMSDVSVSCFCIGLQCVLCRFTAEYWTFSRGFLCVFCRKIFVGGLSWQTTTGAYRC